MKTVKILLLILTLSFIWLWNSSAWEREIFFVVPNIQSKTTGSSSLIRGIYVYKNSDLETYLNQGFNEHTGTIELSIKNHSENSILIKHFDIDLDLKWNDGLVKPKPIIRYSIRCDGSRCWQSSRNYVDFEPIELSERTPEIGPLMSDEFLVLNLGTVVTEKLEPTIGNERYIASPNGSISLNMHYQIRGTVINVSEKYEIGVRLEHPPISEKMNTIKDHIAWRFYHLIWRSS